MEQNTFKRRPYSAPAFRVLALSYATSILSNTEPIDGKDDPDIDW